MMTRIGKGRSLAALVLGLTISAMSLAPAAAAAKDDSGKDRLRFYGWVESMPEGFQGTWHIGGRQVTTDPRTQFDQADGPLMVGGCAKVEIRGGVVHEIDSEPANDCR